MSKSNRTASTNEASKATRTPCENLANGKDHLFPNHRKNTTELALLRVNGTVHILEQASRNTTKVGAIRNHGTWEDSSHPLGIPIILTPDGIVRQGP